MPSHFSSADTDTNKNFSVSPSFFFAESNRPRYIHQNWTAITHRPESSICTGPSLSHFNAQTTAQRALHILYEDCFVACCDWYRILDPHASPRPIQTSLYRQNGGMHVIAAGLWKPTQVERYKLMLTTVVRKQTLVEQRTPRLHIVRACLRVSSVTVRQNLVLKGQRALSFVDKFEYLSRHFLDWLASGDGLNLCKRSNKNPFWFP